MNVTAQIRKLRHGYAERRAMSVIGPSRPFAGLQNWVAIRAERAWLNLLPAQLGRERPGADVSWRSIARSTLGSDREQENPAHDQRQGPNQIKIDPSAPQETDTDPLVYGDGDDTDCQQHRSGVDAEYSKSDRH
jgi:hypothetical protein